MNKERLIKLADFLDTLKPVQFNFRYVWENGPCGSVGCAMGWAPNVFPEILERSKFGNFVFKEDKKEEYIYSIDDYTYSAAAERLFDISHNEGYMLFTPFEELLEERYVTTSGLPWGGSPERNATPQEVANSIRDFVKWKEENHV